MQAMAHCLSEDETANGSWTEASNKRKMLVGGFHVLWCIFLKHFTFIIYFLMIVHTDLRRKESDQEAGPLGLSMWHIYRLECIKSGRSYVGASEHIEERLKTHYGKPPKGLLEDMVAWQGNSVEKRTRKEWFCSQVRVHIEATGMWSKIEASHQEGAYIALHPRAYNVIKSGAPGKCRQGYAIMASRRKSKHY